MDADEPAAGSPGDPPESGDRVGAPGEVDPVVSQVLAGLGVGLDNLQAANLARLSDGDLQAVLGQVEVVSRRVASLQVDVLGEVDRRRLHAVDGHPSAKVMIRHVGQLSSGEALGRDRTRRALADLPAVADAYRAGLIGTDQVRLIGRVHANKRVREHLPTIDVELVARARESSYRDFELVLKAWERLIEQEGDEDGDDRNHRTRDAKLIQNPSDLSWHLSGQFSAFQGAAMHEILDHYLQTEWEADWATARAEHGAAASEDDLPRTPAQRRADAIYRIFQDAASTPPGSAPPDIVHNVIWSADTYFAFLNLFDAHATGTGTGTEQTCPGDAAGSPATSNESDEAEPSPRASASDTRSPTAGDGAPPTPAASSGGHRGPRAGPVGLDQGSYRCHTLDGLPLEPYEAAAASLVTQVRRVLVDAAGVVIDLGRRARLFTGSARTAVKLQATHCIWPGCQTPTSRCEADHLRPHRDGGATNPANGAPLCGYHNRWKQHGYSTWRDPTGTWHTHRPDGTEIT